MKYKLKDESLKNHLEFITEFKNTPLINIVIDEPWFRILIQPSQQLIDLINDNCIGGEPDTFKNALLNMIKRLNFNLDEFYNKPIDISSPEKKEKIINYIKDKFNVSKLTYNKIHDPDTIEFELFNDLFESDDNSFIFHFMN